MIIRSVIWKATFYCCYVGNIQTPKPSVYDKRQFVDTFDYIPSESLTEWAERMAYDKTQEMGQESCSELSEEFSVCNIEVEVLKKEEIDTEEIPENIKSRLIRIALDILNRLIEIGDLVKLKDELLTRHNISEEKYKEIIGNQTYNDINEMLGKIS